MSRMIDKLLYRYENESYIIQSKARFVLYLCFSVLILCPMIISYVSYNHMHNSFYNYSVQPHIIAPVALLFILMFAVIIVLYKGFFFVAGHLVLLITLAAVWVTMIVDRSEIIIRLDSISYILAALTMMPIIIHNKKTVIILYTIVNMTIMLIYLVVFNKELNLSNNAYIDYSMDNFISFIIIGITTYNVFSINHKAIEKAECEIMERKKAEVQKDRLQAQLFQSQKLESVGLLAGGVAHDFNNMLAAVQGFAELIRLELGEDNSVKSKIDEIISASKKARDLTGQLLAFARVQPLDKKIIDVNLIISGFTGMLSRTLREDIVIQNKLHDEPCSIEGDPVQMEQVILNLALNAQDAMPDGGVIIIETSRALLDDSGIKGFESAEPGEFVLITVTDNGKGMDREISGKIFDPFFTTKEFGRGTGLGLSIVYGIVKQHRGMVNVNSEMGKGSIFKIYFPFKESSTTADASPPAAIKNPAGHETILVVEDNTEVRNLVNAVLKKYGYNILLAHDAPSAIDIARSFSGQIELLITDVIIPGMNGMQLYEKIKIERPSIKIIYMSGYSSNVITHDGKLDAGIHFIQKPFSIVDFTMKTREVLDL